MIARTNWLLNIFHLRQKHQVKITPAFHSPNGYRSILVGIMVCACLSFQQGKATHWVAYLGVSCIGHDWHQTVLNCFYFNRQDIMHCPAFPSREEVRLSKSRACPFVWKQTTYGNRRLQNSQTIDHLRQVKTEGVQDGGCLGGPRARL